MNVKTNAEKEWLRKLTTGQTTPSEAPTHPLLCSLHALGDTYISDTEPHLRLRQFLLADK